MPPHNSVDSSEYRKSVVFIYLPSTRFPGEGKGTPLQYSCLENPTDRVAWWAAVHGIAEGRTRLSDFTFTFHFHALEKEMATHSSVLAWRVPGTGEPWWAAVYGVAQSRTRLKRLSSSSNPHVLVWMWCRLKKLIPNCSPPWTSGWWRLFRTLYNLKSQKEKKSMFDLI